MTRSAPRSRDDRTVIRVNRRTALELARIYVSSSAHTAALETLSSLPANGWDEETHLLRAEALIGLGRLSEADDVVGPPVLPEPGNVRRFDLWRFLLQLRILHRRGEYKRVIEIGRAYFDAGEEIPSVYLARTAMVVAQSMLIQRRPSDAREFYKHVMELYQRLGSKEGQVDALLGIANTHLLDCHWDRADALYQEARYRYEELGLTDKGLAACINLGVIRVKRGEFLSGRELLLDALTRANQLGARRRAMTIHLALAMTEVRSGNADAARFHLSHVIRAARRDGVARDLGLALEFLGELHMSSGRWSLAERTLHRALAVASRIAPDGDIVFEVKRRLAEVTLAGGDLETARDLAAEARSEAQKFGDSYEVATCERILAEIAWRSGDRETAVRLVASAMMLLGRLGETYERARVEALRCRMGSGSIAGDSRGRSTGGSASCPVSASCGNPGGHAETSRSLTVVSGPVSRGGEMESRGATEEIAAGARGLLDDECVREVRLAGLVTRYPAMIRSLALARTVAKLDVPVLLTGEPGSGLEGLSRLVHRWSGRVGLHVPFHCAGFDPDALERELLGRSGSSGLSQIADGGTLFLDSVSALGPESQRRLARWIRSQTSRREDARVRIVAASRIRNGGSGAAGLVEDLRRELEHVVVDIPPIRERPGDIPLLVHDFVLESARRFGSRIQMPSEVQIEEWKARPWPRNLEELREAVDRYASRSRARIR